MLRILKLTPEFNLFLWTVILSRLAQNLKLIEVVVAFQEMEACRILLNNYTCLSVLNACSLILSLDLRRQIHAKVIMTGMKDDVPVENALINMYMKCSYKVKDGLRVFKGIFDWLPFLTWFSSKFFYSYMEMTTFRLQPNSITLSIILRSSRATKSASQPIKLHGYVIKLNIDHDIVCNNFALCLCWLWNYGENWKGIVEMLFTSYSENWLSCFDGKEMYKFIWSNFG